MAVLWLVNGFCCTNPRKWSCPALKSRRDFLLVIVAINILIAVGSDFQSAFNGISHLAQGQSQWWLSWLYGSWWNIVNGLAGILNISCMTGWWAIYSSKNQQDMLWLPFGTKGQDPKPCLHSFNLEYVCPSLSAFPRSREICNSTGLI